MKLKPFLQGFGILAVLITLIPIVAVDFWWVRMFDYPHIQLTLLTLMAIFAYFLRFKISNWRDYAFMIILVGCFIYQFVKILPYTPFVPYDVGKPTETVDIQTGMMLLTSNVLQKNKEKAILIEEMKKLNPDVAVFTETDIKWADALKSGIGSDYPYKVEVPLDNTYGMLLYSKFKLNNPQVKYIVDDSIPSIHTEIELRSGARIQLHAIHPTPPMPQHNPSSSDRDAEMMKIALESMDSDIPVVVIGDFNDVAWSRTTSMFQTVGELLDVRKGRSFYNTFNAKSFIMRWSLDHIFVSEEFRVEKIGLGDDVKSDHFPFYAQLFLQPELAEEQKPDEAPEDEIRKAKEQIAEEEKENTEKGPNGSSNQ
ncbi:endonuclease/exonuclease/phosphatase family protein [Christiangramia sp. OXR-203]|jgi:endonuclease/exonuclease/phosphatase (EEP) superfamily protein YafD|uniref:endonuclease/exonuclease/phosphatase family protein n=1 Tax=Christiangramia sp. OXR-203 TaxID=3100176 RepID=UPI002AC8A8A2|nr:endonuclease/exonuclease/phosphatase family protein [Christiangramia sp. OXR-203]WPY97217.1 endonuclease/exonuclease/phosphatase family protein [Christiangramia sp. OXR-203]